MFPPAFAVAEDSPSGTCVREVGGGLLHDPVAGLTPQSPSSRKPRHAIAKGEGMAATLFGVSTTDPLVFGGVPSASAYDWEVRASRGSRSSE